MIFRWILLGALLCPLTAKATRTCAKLFELYETRGKSTSRLTIRVAQPADFNALERILVDPVVTGQSGTLMTAGAARLMLQRSKFRVQDFLDFQDEGGAINFAIFEPGGVEPLGLVRLEKLHKNVSSGPVLKENFVEICEISYVLAPHYHGQGYASEAVRDIVSFAFDTLKVEGVMAHVAPENLPSIRLLEKQGFGIVEEVPLIGRTYFLRKENFLKNVPR